MALIVQTCGVVGTLIAATIGVRSYMNTSKRAEDAKKREQETQELALKTQQHNLETRQAQLFMFIYDKWIAKDFVESNHKIQTIDPKKIKGLKELERSSGWEDVVRIGTYFEGLGVLVREELIDVRLVSLFIYGEVKGFWESWGLFLIDYRVVHNYPRAWIEAEFLYDRVIDYGKSQLQQS
jgi:hypothetical protein